MRYEKGTFVTIPNIHILKGLKPHVQAVYMWITIHSNEKGVCFPSRRRLAESSGIGLRTLDSSINILCTKGLLKKTSRVDPENPKFNLSNIYQMMILQEEGGAGDALGGAGDMLGVVHEMPSELYPIRTIKRRITDSHVSGEIIEVRESKEGKEVISKKRDTEAWKLKEELYKMFKKSTGVDPVPNIGDYKNVVEALKRLKSRDIKDMVEHQLEYENPITVRNALSNYKITKYLQENS